MNWKLHPSGHGLTADGKSNRYWIEATAACRGANYLATAKAVLLFVKTPSHHRFTFYKSYPHIGAAMRKAEQWN